MQAQQNGDVSDGRMWADRLSSSFQSPQPVTDFSEIYDKPLNVTDGL